MDQTEFARTKTFARKHLLVSRARATYQGGENIVPVSIAQEAHPELDHLATKLLLRKEQERLQQVQEEREKRETRRRVREQKDEIEKMNKEIKHKPYTYDSEGRIIFLKQLPID